MIQSGYYSIGIDNAKNGDHRAVVAICGDCNSVLVSKLFETDTALIIPKQCPHCNNETDAETATEINHRESILIKREGYAPKEMTMTDISREFSSVFTPTESDPPEPSKAVGFIPYDAEIAILDNTHYLPKSKSDAMLKRYLNHDIGEVLTISPDNTPESFPIPQPPPLTILDESTPIHRYRAAHAPK